MTKQVSPELIDDIISQQRENSYKSMLNVLDRLDALPSWSDIITKVAPNPGTIPSDSNSCLEQMGENPEDYDMDEIDTALSKRKKEKEEERRQQELANRPQRTEVVCFRDKVDEEILDVYGFTMSDNNNYVRLELYSEESGNEMFHVFKSKEHVERFIAHLQEAAKVFS
jgi:hypothetical protein